MPNDIAFSTLGCPEWSVETAIDRAAAYGFQAIDWRGGPQGHVQPSLPAADRARVRQQMAGKGVSALSVSAYTSFVSKDAAENQASVEDLKRHLDLAADIGAHYVRVFLGELRPGVETESVYAPAAACLETAARHAQDVGVRLALEPHDDFVSLQTFAPILDLVGPGIGVLWDLGNTVAAGDDLADAFELLRDRLCYVHVKDGTGSFAGGRHLTPLGEGEVPLMWAFARLLSSGYTGAFSYEWERAWQPELAPPEVAFPAARRAIHDLLSAVERAGALPLAARRGE